ncbi:hypothetical protein DFQ28_010081 [Apophysomyces sp. BC1034]|nr:hypothetical protein DFQ28_010081 [Apophysomyces sp. BC1034]
MRVPTPKLRLKRKRQRTVESGISVEQALQSLYGVFQKQLKTIIIKVLEDKPEKKPTKKLQQQSEKQKQEKKMKKQHQLREEMEKADRIPRTSFEQVDAMLNAAQGTARKVLASEYPGAGQIGTLWREYARANFDDAVEQAKNEIEERVETEEEGSSVAVVETNDSEGQEDIVRTCSVRLPAILRDDLNDEVKQMFLDAVAETSEQATDYVAELGTVMHATMLKYAAGSVTLDPSSKAATYHQDNSKVFNVLDVLSEESVRNPEVLNSDSTTPAAPLPENESTYLKALPKKTKPIYNFSIQAVSGDKDTKPV